MQRYRSFSARTKSSDIQVNNRLQLSPKSVRFRSVIPGLTLFLMQQTIHKEQTEGPLLMVDVAAS
jgi:hypothetical protein